MSLTPSTMLELGTVAPDFSLPTPDGENYTLVDRDIAKGLLVVFMCNHCPYVIHIRQELVKRLHEYQNHGIEVVTINSNDFGEYPDDSPKKMAAVARELNFSFPYLVDENQEVAQAYRAACTPDFFLFDAEKKLVYRGQFDSARPSNKEPVNGVDLTQAVQQTVAGEIVAIDQRPSMGCNIKWKKGNEPEYYG